MSDAIEWAETTLRKGTKKPKICRDMFISDSRGVFTLCIVKNGRLKIRKALQQGEAISIIENNKLFPIQSSIFNNCSTQSSIFNNCSTYRTYKSIKLINAILGA